MPTRWKQPCVIWEASKLGASCSIGGACCSKPSRCQYCGGTIRSPHALDGYMVANARKSKLFVQCSKNLALRRFLQSVVNHLLGHFVHRFPESNSLEETGQWFSIRMMWMWRLSGRVRRV